MLLGLRAATPESLGELEAALRDEAADAIVLDYDETRRQWRELLAGDDASLDLVQVIKAGRMVELNARLTMGVLSQFVAPRRGVSPDAEYEVALRVAAERGLPVVLGRRPVDQEAMRAWRCASVGGRIGFAGRLLKGSLKRSELTEDQVAQAHEAGALEEALRAGRACAGSTATVFFDEASAWLAARVDEVAGRVVIVSNAASLDPLAAALRTASPAAGFDVVPPKSLFSRTWPWAVTVAVVAAFILGWVFADAETMMAAASIWFTANMTLAAIGAAVAWGHPVTVIATSISAPFVSLNPAVGAGMVGALVQAFVAPPTVRDMERVGDDIARLSGWWTNRLARLLLIFVSANLFSTIGSFVAVALMPTQ